MQTELSPGICLASEDVMKKKSEKRKAFRSEESFGGLFNVFPSRLIIM